MSGDWKNKLYFGDNLDIMRDSIGDESVDLIYLDPPFNSKATYNVLFKEKDGAESSAQITAFDDTWHWDIHSERVYAEIVTAGPKKLADLVQALRAFLGTNDMMAYLTMMAVRLIEMRRILTSTGSLYLHCDPTASHYLKLVLDAVFGVENFRNEIVWKRTSAKGLAFSRFASNHDVIYYYSKSGERIWKSQYSIHKPEYIKKFYKYIEPETGRRYRLDNLANPNPNRPNLTYEFLGVTRVWRWTKERMTEAFEKGLIVQKNERNVPCLKRYLDEQEGTPVGDIWTDILPIQSQAAERLGYPTQKPEALLERIINASSNEGDVVFDPFCGCGTTIAAAEKLNRRWIGIDITHLAITLMKHRLQDAFGRELSPFEIIGDPKDIESAAALRDQNRHQFEWWALSLVGARPAQDKKKGADRGVDGYLYFFDDNSGAARKVVVQVKSGHVSVSQIRDLIGVIEREKAVIGAFLTFEPPTRPMIEEAATAGFYEITIPVSGRHMKFPRLQILTIEDLLNGKELDYPPWSLDVTHRKAQRKSKTPIETQEELFDDSFDEDDLSEES